MINTLLGHSGYVLALILLPNGFIASGSADSTIKIWDITKTYPLYNLTGHTDSTGNDDYNMELSRNRVDEVFDYLVEKAKEHGAVIVKPVWQESDENGFVKMATIESTRC